MPATKLHAEWLSLLDVSGPFLSLNVLDRVFPQGLDTIDSSAAAELAAAHEEWSDNRNIPAIHGAWVRYVLSVLLGWDDSVLAEGQSLPSSLRHTAAEQGGETIRPAYALHRPGQPLDVHALVTVYPADQALEKVMTGALWAASPAARMLALLRATGVRVGLVTNGEEWMLVSAGKAGAAGYISWYAELWREERVTLRAFTSLLTLSRFLGVADEDTLSAMLDASLDDAQEVTDQLGKQVRRAVEILVRAFDRADQDVQGALLAGVSENTLYEAALTVMMRLVFLLSAEERGLFLLGDPVYDQNYAVSTLRAQLHEAADHTGEEVLERRSDAWGRLLAVTRMVHGGSHHEDLQLPAYGGSLFDPDKFPFLEGRAPGVPDAPPPAIDNRTVLHLLDALQILQMKGEARRLSFRALDIEQIGHVYEGLLDHEARRADEIMLGFSGPLEPEIPLATVEAQTDISKFLKEETGRSTVNAIRSKMEKQPDDDALRRLRDQSCHGDRELFERVRPYLNLLQEDEFGNPVVIHPGSAFVTAGAARRSTGTHYTPRSLTEPIVEHTLEPVVYHGPAEGLPREQWTLKPPAGLLALKVCDMAMGSGAFLVQACRYLSERLVEAWERAIEGEGPGVRALTVDGTPASGAASEMLIPAEAEERLVLARRLVADRCLYGVDKNPLAVEMAKLSLWLTTLAKGRAFTFLDHALKCGDSLVGASVEQLQHWSLDTANTPTMFAHTIRSAIDEVIAARRELEGFTVQTVDDQLRKAALLARAHALTNDLRTAADHLIASYFNDLAAAEQNKLRADLLNAFTLRRDIPAGWHIHLPIESLRPFHWELEFPEVFYPYPADGNALGVRAGFDAIVGNPPFLGGKAIGNTLGNSYRDFIARYKNGRKGFADLCVYFLLRAFENLRSSGSLGLIATSSISETDSKYIGLDQIVDDGGDLYHATSYLDWPGKAAVVISIVHLAKSGWAGERWLNSEPVSRISTSLDTLIDASPFRLASMRGLQTEGIKIMGEGFVMTPEEKDDILSASPMNVGVIKGYFVGEDMNSLPEVTPIRWIVDFSGMTADEAARFEVPFDRVQRLVKPYRDGLTGQIHERRFWLYWDKRPALESYLRFHRAAFAMSAHTKYVALQQVTFPNVFNHGVKLFLFDDWRVFAALQSSLHDAWVRWTSGRLGSTTTSYSTSDSFDTFSFPSASVAAAGDSIGTTYHETRRQIMLDRWEGLTATYNRFNNSKENSADIANLRGLHRQMDEAVALAYGWSDMDLGHGFHETAQGTRYTIAEPARREVLKRLLALNHERYAEEVAQGLHSKAKGGKGKKPHPPTPSPLRNEGVQGTPAALASNRFGIRPFRAQPLGQSEAEDDTPPEQSSFLDDEGPKQGRLF